MAAAMEEGATVRLARFVQETRWADLPEEARHAGRRAIVNIVGCCLGGARHEIVETSACALLPYAGRGVAGLLGRSEQADILTASLLNCLASAAYSFDDTHAESIIHPSGAAATALLALSEQHAVSGEDFLLAFALGVDVACRVSKAVSMPPAEGDIGWSQTGVAAGIGAAAAAAKALGLDRQRTTWALAIAAQEACGFRAAHGSMAATLIFGHAAQSGLRAALLARQGLSAPQAALEGKFGFMSLFASRPHLPYLTEGLGTRFEVEALAYKPYPCGVVIHPALDAALAWRKQHSDPSLVERVRLRVHPSAQELGFRRHPANVLEAKVSLFHWVAAALATGRAGLAEGQRACMDDAAVVRLRELIELQADAAMRADAAELAVALRDGREQDIAICPCKGSVANPMTDEDLSTKFRGQAAMTLAAAPAGQVLEACWNIDRLQDVAQVARMARALPPV